MCRLLPCVIAVALGCGSQAAPPPPAQVSEAHDVELLDKFVVNGALFYYHNEHLISPSFYANVTNNTEHTIGKVYFDVVVRGKDREIPYASGVANYEIGGGIEPGENAELYFGVLRTGEWTKLPESPDDVLATVTTLKPWRIDGPDGKSIARSR